MEVTSVLGWLAGIAEIAKAAFGGDLRGGDGKSPPPARARPTGPFGINESRPEIDDG